MSNYDAKQYAPEALWAQLVKIITSHFYRSIQTRTSEASICITGYTFEYRLEVEKLTQIHALLPLSRNEDNF